MELHTKARRAVVGGCLFFYMAGLTALALELMAKKAGMHMPGLIMNNGGAQIGVMAGLGGILVLAVLYSIWGSDEDVFP